MHYMTAGILMSLVFNNKSCLLENVTGNVGNGLENHVGKRPITACIKDHWYLFMWQALLYDPEATAVNDYPQGETPPPRLE